MERWFLSWSLAILPSPNASCFEASLDNRTIFLCIAAIDPMVDANTLDVSVCRLTKEPLLVLFCVLTVSTVLYTPVDGLHQAVRDLLRAGQERKTGASGTA